MRRQKGMRCVPEERNGHGAIINMSLSENALLTASHEPDNVSASGLVSWVKCHALSRKIIGSYDVRTPHHDPLAGSLSGGNLQKFMIGREMMSRPRLLIVAQPTWGVDIGAAQAIRAAMRTLLEELISRHSTRSPAEIAADIERDKILTAAEAVEYGLIDQVLASRKAKA